MTFRASHFLGLPAAIGLPLVCLALAGCPGDDGSSSGTGSSTGGSGASSSTGGSPVTGDTTVSADSTGSDTGMGSGTDETTTGGPVQCPYEPVEGTPSITLEPVASGFDRPVLAVGHPTEPDRLFVVEQGGDVRILEPGETTAPMTAFLHVDVQGAGNTNIGAEFGLLGFAFHPDFPTDPRVYVNYNPPTGGGGGDLHTVVSEFTLSAGDPNLADPGSERIILDLYQPAGNHNGGMIQFGPDGYLYIGMGDGGGSGDTYNTGRNTGVLLSKMLRIGVEPDGTDDNPESCAGCPQYGPFDYTIPADNPFVGDAAFAPEIYAWGLRNPWRFSWDFESDMLYVADVGQNNYEEIDVVQPGDDLGWSDMEGFHCFGGAPCEVLGPNEVNADGMRMPIVEYDHNDGCSVTGMGVYRSCEVPGWAGLYLYGDFCSGTMWGLVWDGSNILQDGVVLNQGELPLGYGYNAYGDVFVTTVDAILGGMIFDGLVYRVAPGA